MIKWGKFDWKDIAHLLIGALVFFALYGLWDWMNLDDSLDAKWVALMGTFSVAFLWEYFQKWRNHRIAMDVKDMVVTCLIGLAYCIFA